MVDDGTTAKSEGHRRRLREKFLKSGLEGFHDYEVVELLLSLGTPRRDCKRQAKEAIERFRTLRGVLAAPLDELMEIKGIGAHSAFGLKLMQEVAREFLKARIIDKPFYKSSQEVFEYLYHSMRDLPKEVFKVLYLNSQNQIQDTLTLSEGTVNSNAVSSREVMEGALKQGAVSLIFAHNHPSGNPQPSVQDRQVTRDLVFCGKIMQINVLDHLIIGDNTYYSFSAQGLIEEYEMDFLNLRLRGTAAAKKRLYSARSKPEPADSGSEG